MLQRALFLQSGGNSVCIYLIPNLSRKPCEGSGLKFRLDRKLIHGNFILKESGGISVFSICFISLAFRTYGRLYSRFPGIILFSLLGFLLTLLSESNHEHDHKYSDAYKWQCNSNLKIPETQIQNGTYQEVCQE